MSEALNLLQGSVLLAVAALLASGTSFVETIKPYHSPPAKSFTTVGKTYRVELVLKITSKSMYKNKHNSEKRLPGECINKKVPVICGLKH